MWSKHEIYDSANQQLQLFYMAKNNSFDNIA